MRYTIKQIGTELKEELEKGSDITKISRWASKIYHNNLRELGDMQIDILECLLRMEDDPQFELTVDELNEIAENLIFEGEKEELAAPIPEIRDRAEDLGDNWLMCSLCQEAWQSESEYGMVLCPQCNHKLHNPKFRSP